MATRCKGVNSKCFIFSYLIIVGFILVLWVNRYTWNNDDQREIPADLQPLLESPPRSLPDLALVSSDKLVLTNSWFQQKWTFVYFSHSHCLPACRSSLEQMKHLQAALANADVQFLLIGIDTQNDTPAGLSQFLRSQSYAFTVGLATDNATEALARVFRALFLRTDFTDGSYRIEQEHAIFLVDPKGRVYATFRPPYSNVNTDFFALRRFYALTE